MSDNLKPYALNDWVEYGHPVKIKFNPEYSAWVKHVLESLFRYRFKKYRHMWE